LFQDKEQFDRWVVHADGRTTLDAVDHRLNLAPNALH
jgi:predicted naringenin-chalcone synthase